MSAFTLKNSKPHPITNDYEIGKCLGTGKFSLVKLVTHKVTKVSYAAKFIDPNVYSLQELEKEVEIMREIDEYPSVIHLKDIYSSKNNEHILILELVHGGELFDKIVEYENYSQKDAAQLIYQIVSIVKYLHNKNIVHRDLKPENLLFEDESAKNLKLCDFGLADKIKGDELLYLVAGSPTYMAPEISTGQGYGKAIDMYSIGVILYILLCGYPPFEPEVGIVDLDFPSPEWDHISDSIKILLAKLLNNNPAERPTTSEMLQHPWVSGDKVSGKALVSTIRTIANFNTIRREPGATMRQKDANSKMPVFSIFARNLMPPSNLSQLENHHPSTHSNHPSGNIAPRSKKSASREKNQGRNLAIQDQSPSQSRVNESKNNDNLGMIMISDRSVRDISKKMAELNDGTSYPNDSSFSDQHLSSGFEASEYSSESRERIRKLLKQLSGQRSKKRSLKARFRALEVQLESSSQLLKEKEELCKSTMQEVEKEKAANNQLKKSINQLENELSADKDNIDRINRRASEFEKSRNELEDKLIEARTKLDVLMMQVNIETIVAEQLKCKRIQELESALEEASRRLAHCTKSNTIPDLLSSQSDHVPLEQVVDSCNDSLPNNHQN